MTMNKKKKLPVGIQDFPTLIEEDYLYIDKTELIYQLILNGKGDFFSRPRRFGKSLLLSTLEAIFLGRKELFKGLWIDETDYSWETYPVIFLDFSRLDIQNKEELKSSLNELLLECAERNAIPFLPAENPSRSLSRMIMECEKQGKKIVILIDEYDTPLVKAFNRPELQEEIRCVLHDFFVTIKALGKFERYVFVTGVSKFSKVSLFSGMNNLEDISFNENYSSLAGITENEIGHHYRPFIEKISEQRKQSIDDVQKLIREWYNGYRFTRSKTPTVYNPVSLHLFLKNGELANYWFGTATPTFAIQMIKHLDYPVLNFENGISIGGALEEHHEVNKPNLIPLLYQTGYLTITDYTEENRIYRLSFPNREVKISFYDHLMTGLTELDATQLGIHFNCLKRALQEVELEDFFSSLNVLFAEIPYMLHLPKEAYYHSLIYLILRSLNFSVSSEMATSLGRLDLVVESLDQIYIFEFKFGGSAEAALKQIEEKGYANRFKGSQKPVTLIGVNIDRNLRKISDWLHKKI